MTGSRNMGKKIKNAQKMVVFPYFLTPKDFFPKQGSVSFVTLQCPKAGNEVISLSKRHQLQDQNKYDYRSLGQNPKILKNLDLRNSYILLFGYILKQKLNVIIFRLDTLLSTHCTVPSMVLFLKFICLITNFYQSHNNQI